MKNKTRTINPHLIEPLSLFHIWEADLEVEKNGDSGEHDPLLVASC